MGLKTIKWIGNILCGIINEDTMELIIWPSEKTVMTYTLIAYCDVERYFNRFRFVLRPSHRSFNFENVYTVIWFAIVLL